MKYQNTTEPRNPCCFVSSENLHTKQWTLLFIHFNLKVKDYYYDYDNDYGLWIAKT